MTDIIKPFPELNNITPITIPFNEVPFLLTSNVFALGRDEITLVDAGPGIPGAIDCVKDTMKKAGLKFNNITRILLTHGHMDHFGLAASIRREIDHHVEIYIHPEDLWRVKPEFFNNEIWVDELDWLQEFAGIPDDDLNAMKKVVRRYYSIATPLDDLTPMEDNDLFSGDGYRLKVVSTPGHAPGLCCLYEPDQKVLFCSDHILKNITPKPILALTREKTRDQKFKSLIAYDKSLDKVSKIDVRYLFPGHGEWIRDMHPLIAQYRDHFSRRMELVWQTVKKKEVPLFHMVEDVFPHAEKGDLFIALSEIISQLDVLVNLGRVAIIEQGPPVIYRAL